MRHVFSRIIRSSSAGVLIVALSASAASAAQLSPAWKLCHAADPDERIKGCTQILSDAKKEPRHNQLAAYVNRGAAFQAKGDHARAIEDYSLALQIEPGSVVTLLARGAAHQAKGDLDAALADDSSGHRQRQEIRRRLCGARVRSSCERRG